MLIEFSVQNFGSIKGKQTLSFEATKDKHLEDYYIIPTKTKGLRLLKLGLIYGANASGKTTILQALDFLRDIVLMPYGKKDIPFHFEPFLFDKKTPNENTIFNISFIQKDIRYEYEVELNKKAIERESLDFYAPNKANVFTRETNIKNQYTDKITFGSKIEIDKNIADNLKANTLWNNTVIGGFVKTNIENKQLKDVRDWFHTYLKPIIHIRTELFEYITELLISEKKSLDKDLIIKILRAADFNVSDLSIKKRPVKIPIELKNFFETLDKKMTKFTKNDENKNISDGMILDVTFEHSVEDDKFNLPINSESQGTQRYYELAGILLLLIKNSIIIPIDELEKSLHPDLFRHFLLSFLTSSKKSQVIATTHNREILNDKDIFRKDVIWITDKNKEGATRLYSLSDFDSSVIRDTTSIYNAYKIGKLGGIPNLGSYHIEVESE